MFGVVIVSLILISSIVMVSAGFKDWFTFGEESELEGELESQDFDARVELAFRKASKGKNKKLYVIECDLLHPLKWMAS